MHSYTNLARVPAATLTNYISILFHLIVSLYKRWKPEFWIYSWSHINSKIINFSVASVLSHFISDTPSLLSRPIITRSKDLVALGAAYKCLQVFTGSFCVIKYFDWIEKKNNLFWIKHVIEVPSENQIGHYELLLDAFSKRGQVFNMKITFYSYWNKTQSHMEKNGFALCLMLKARLQF